MFLDIVEKSGLNGVIAGCATGVLFGTKAQVYVPIANSTAPLTVLAFAVGASGSIIGDLTHKFIKEEIHISEKAKDSVSMLSAMVINGGLFAGLLYCFDPKVLSDFGYLQAFGVGAASEFAGAASYSYLKENLYL